MNRITGEDKSGGKPRAVMLVDGDYSTVLAKRLRKGVEEGAIDFDTCLSAADWIEKAVLGQSLAEQSGDAGAKSISINRELLEYITKCHLRIETRVARTIIYALLEGSGNVVNQHELCELVKCSPASLRVHISKLRSYLSSIGYDNVIASIRMSKSTEESGYIISSDTAQMILTDAGAAIHKIDINEYIAG